MIKDTKNPFFKILGYLTYAFILFFTFIYLRFPYNTLKDNITRNISASIKKKVSVKSASHIFPLGMKFNYVTVNESIKGNGNSIFSAKEVMAKLSFKSLFSKTKNVFFNIKAYGGNISGNVIHINNKSGNSVSLNADFSDLNSKKYPLKELKLMRDPIKTTLDGAANLNFSIKNNKISRGNLNLTLNSGILEDIKVYGFKIPVIRYDSSKTKINFQDKRIDINRLTINSKDMNVKVNGSISLKKVILQSILSLSLKYKISKGFINKLGIPAGMLSRKKDNKGFSTINIKGTLRRPMF